MEKVYEGRAYYGTNKCQMFNYWGLIDDNDDEWLSEDDYNKSSDESIISEEFVEFLNKNEGKKVRVTIKWELVD